MNSVLGEDYSRKVALVALLREYAEVRDVARFARDLDALLPSAQHRAILPELR